MFGGRMRVTVLWAVVLLLSTQLQAGELGEVDLADVDRDCRIEGDAAGFKGDVLEEFVESCIEDLYSTTYSNTI